MLSVVPLSRPLDPLWTSFVLWFFSVWLQVLLVYFTPTYVFSYFWLKINSILSVSSCVTSYSLQWILKINSLSVLLVLLPCFSHCFKFLSSLSDFKHYPLHEVTVDLFFFSVFSFYPVTLCCRSKPTTSSHGAVTTVSHFTQYCSVPIHNHEQCAIADFEDASVSNSWWRLRSEAQEYAGFCSK